METTGIMTADKVIDQARKLGLVVEISRNVYPATLYGDGTIMIPEQTSVVVRIAQTVPEYLADTFLGLTMRCEALTATFSRFAPRSGKAATTGKCVAMYHDTINKIGKRVYGYRRFNVTMERMANDVKRCAQLVE